MGNSDSRSLNGIAGAVSIVADESILRFTIYTPVPIWV